MAFVKVVEGSEIYNFPIYHFVHFYSNFFGKNVVKRWHTNTSRAAPRRAAPRRTAPSRAPDLLDVRAPHFPRLHAPREPPEVLSSSSSARSYQGRRLPLGASPSALRSQASTHAELKGSRCSSLDMQDPPHCFVPRRRHHGCCSVNGAFPFILSSSSHPAPPWDPVEASPTARCPTSPWPRRNFPPPWWPTPGIAELPRRAFQRPLRPTKPSPR
jgi:hypothetical protein